MIHRYGKDDVPPAKSRLGLALGGGSARGWAHIGVINELEKLGIRPDVVCGTSIGALVGGIYVGGYLEQLTEWLLQLEKVTIIKFLDIALLTGGGFVEGRRLINFFHGYLGDINIEELPRPYACVATGLYNGREIWFQNGPLLDAIRASIALPGFFTPVYLRGQWLVDGGLVNPVPVSLCRALGADTVIAVNLNGDLLGRKAVDDNRHDEPPNGEPKDISAELSLLQRLSEEMKLKADALLGHVFDNGHKVQAPGLFEVLAGSIAIMQDRLTRSRMAGDPPDITISPRTRHIGLLEFDRAAEAITAGRESVQRARPALEYLLEKLA